MKDVAKLSGVSQTTVSLIINKVPKANISEKTKQAVRKAIKQLGYRPNVIAQNLRTRQSHVIGLITDEISVTPFAGTMILGVLDALRENGKLLMMMNSGGEEELEIEQIEALLSRQIEGNHICNHATQGSTCPGIAAGNPVCPTELPGYR